MDAQAVAYVVETYGMGELGEEQAHHMTPCREGACLFVDAVLAGELAHKMTGYELAELRKN